MRGEAPIRCSFPLHRGLKTDQSGSARAGLQVLALAHLRCPDEILTISASLFAPGFEQE